RELSVKGLRRVTTLVQREIPEAAHGFRDSWLFASDALERPAGAEGHLARPLDAGRREEVDAARARVDVLTRGHRVRVEQVDHVGIHAEAVHVDLDHLLQPQVHLVDEVVLPRPAWLEEDGAARRAADAELAAGEDLLRREVAAAQARV